MTFNDKLQHKWVNDGFSVPSRPQRMTGKKQALQFF